MARLHITELRDLVTDRRGATTPVAQVPEIAQQVVAIGSSSDASEPFNSKTRFVRLETDVNCHILIGYNDPEATTGNIRMPADLIEVWGVEPGMQVAVIEGA